MAFLTIFLIVFALLNLYIVKRFINKLDLNSRIQLYLKIFLAINYIGIIGYVIGRYYSDIPNWLYFLLSLPIGIVFLLFCTAIVYDISRLFLDKSNIEPSRRDFFKKTLDISSLAIATGLTSRAIYEARHIELENIDIKLKNLKEKYSIVQLSDIHIGGLINEKFIKQMVDRINALNPDLVVITGDMVDVKINRAIPALKELKNIKTKYGTHFIVGNHEYFHGVEEIIQTVKNLGINVLENQNVYIGKKNQGFNLAGVYDVMGERMEHHQPNLDEALKGVDTSSPTILLAHQPRYVESVSGVDLMLSGHTHGGQIYPFKFLVKLTQPYISGLYKHDEDLQVYVNKGTGFWGPPMRLGASSEITFITVS